MYIYIYIYIHTYICVCLCVCMCVSTRKNSLGSSLQCSHLTDLIVHSPVVFLLTVDIMT